MEPIVGQVAAAVGPLETAALPPPLVGSVDIDAADADGEAEDAPTDSRRNWSPEVLLQLARIYRRMSAAHPELSRVGRMQLVYDEFKQRVDCSHRSRKAVDDKLYAMKQMYHFVVKMNGNFKLGGRKSPPSWFELTKEERRAVRSLHRVRIPNISIEVFNVLDSVLNPEHISTASTEDADTLSSLPAAIAVPATPSPTADGLEVVDTKRNWSEDVTIRLAKAWNAVNQQAPELKGAVLSQHVYNTFMSAVGCSNRSRKAVDDKMHSIREMYRFIRTYEAQREAGENKLAWFELNKKQRREIRAQHKIRVPNLSPTVYHEIDQVMTRSNLDSGDTSSPEQSSTEIDMLSRYSFTSAPDHTDASDSALSPSNNLADRTGSVVQESGVESAAEPARAGSAGTANGSINAERIASGVSGAAAVGSTPPSLLPSPFDSNEPHLAKRRRLQPDDSTLAPAVASASGSSAVVEQIRAMLDADRQERRQQHAEQMAALRELTELLRQKPCTCTSARGEPRGF